MENPTIGSSFCWAPSTFTIRKLVSSEAVAKKPFDPTIGSLGQKTMGRSASSWMRNNIKKMRIFPKIMTNIMFIMKMYIYNSCQLVNCSYNVCVELGESYIIISMQMQKAMSMSSFSLDGKLKYACFLEDNQANRSNLLRSKVPAANIAGESLDHARLCVRLWDLVLQMWSQSFSRWNGFLRIWSQQRRQR